MGKRKNDGKDIYRKKASSGEIVRNLEKEYLVFINEFKKIPRDQPKHIVNFIIDKFGVSGLEEKNPDLKIIVFCENKELKKILIDLGNRGANLTTIWDVLKTPKIEEYLINGHPIGLQLYEGELSQQWNGSIKKFMDKKRDFFNEVRVIRNAIRLIMELKPITLKDFYKDELPWVNDRLLAAQRMLNEIIDIYLNAKAIKDGLIGYPAKWGFSIDKLLRQKFRPLTQKSHKIWNRRIVILVDELKRIGYSKHQSYIKAGELLHLAFPLLYKDNDPNRVRQRYTYQIKLK